MIMMHNNFTHCCIGHMQPVALYGMTSLLHDMKFILLFVLACCPIWCDIKITFIHSYSMV